MLTLNRFCTLLMCFHGWLSPSKCWLSRHSMTYAILKNWFLKFACIILLENISIKSIVPNNQFCLKILFTQFNFPKTSRYGLFWWLQEEQKLLNLLNPLSTSVALTKKPINWFAQQITWLVSIWGQHWHLMG